MADVEQAPPLPPRAAPATTLSPETSPRPTTTPAPPTIPNATSTSTSLSPMPTSTPAQPAAAAPPTAMAGIMPTASPNSRGFRQKLDAGEQHWRWKVATRAFLIVVGIIGVGCMSFATSVAFSENMLYEYSLDEGWSIVWSLITFSISVLWCGVVILVLLLRKAPVHPGVVVSIDLLLWLAYIPTAMFAVAGVLSVTHWGESGIIHSYYSGGYYSQASNGTWVWDTDRSSSTSSRGRGCEGTGGYGSGYTFSSCAEQDAYVNYLWQSKGHRAGIEVTGVVCQLIGLFFHFGLFVWACVDTHRRNSKKVSKDAEQLAADIVMNMVKNGAIIPAPSSTYQPPVQNLQQRQHQYQQPVNYQQVPLPPPKGWIGTTSTPVAPHQPENTNEKGQAPRFS